MFSFSSGMLYGLTQTTPVQPRRFGALQDVSVDLAFTKKVLYGQNQWGLAIGRGTAKVTGKAKLGIITAATFNDLFFNGQTSAAQSLIPQFQEGPTAIPATPFQITVSQAANWVDDLGAYDSVTGLPLTRVTSAPAAGQYSVAAGVYTFSSADNVSGKSVLIDYTYKTTTAGASLTLNARLAGDIAMFGMILTTKFQGKGFYLKLNNVGADKLSFPTKMDDFIIPELDFEAVGDAAGILGTFASGD